MSRSSVWDIHSQKLVWLVEDGLLDVTDDVAVFADDLCQRHLADLIELRLAANWTHPALGYHHH